MSQDVAPRVRQLVLFAALGLAPPAGAGPSASWARAEAPASPAERAVDVVDRALPRGGRMLVSRVPDAETVHLRIGFACVAPPRTLARYARSLERALGRALARQLASRDLALSVEHDDAAVVVVVTGAAERFPEHLPLVARALAAPRFVDEPAVEPPPREEDDGVRRSTIDLTGAPLVLGPEVGPGPERGARAAASAAFALLLDAERGALDAALRDAEPPLAALDALHAATAARANMVVAVLGDLDVEAAFQLADEAAAALLERDAASPGAGAAAPAAPALVVPLAREVWARGDAGRTAAGFAVLGAACRADAPDAAALVVLEEVLRARVARLADGAQVAGLAFAPGFGRSGRIAAWVGGEVAGVASSARDLLALLDAAGEAADGEVAEAKQRARARLLPREDALLTLQRDHLLALRGAPPSWRARLAAEVEDVTGSALQEAARRHVVTSELLCAAVTRPDALASLAPLGLLVDVSARDAASDTPPDAVAEREAARAAVARLFEALGGRARWAAVHAAELHLTYLRGAQAVRATMILDLDQPRLVLAVEDGGTTTLDGSVATWRNGQERRALDAEAMARDASLGALAVLHQLALEDRLDARLVGDELVLTDLVFSRAALALDAAGRPVRLRSTAPGGGSWRLAEWASFQGQLVPTSIEDESRGVRIVVRACRLLEQFDPSVLR